MAVLDRAHSSSLDDPRSKYPHRSLTWVKGLWIWDWPMIQAIQVPLASGDQMLRVLLIYIPQEEWKAYMDLYQVFPAWSLKLEVRYTLAWFFISKWTSFFMIVHKMPVCWNNLQFKSLLSARKGDISVSGGVQLHRRPTERRKKIASSSEFMNHDGYNQWMIRSTSWPVQKMLDTTNVEKLLTLEVLPNSQKCYSCRESLIMIDIIDELEG